MKKNRCFSTIIIPLLVVMCVFVSSCEKYLDEPPSKSSSVLISTTQHLDALLDNYSSMGVEPHGLTRIISTDDIGFTPDLPSNAPTHYGSAVAFFPAVWDRAYMEGNANNDWTFQWGRIFTANLILSSLEKVSGPEADKTRLKSEAHYIRAYAYWILANTYCLPFTNANRDEPGLPLKLSTSFEEDLTRAPLYRIYELIESDLAEALKTTRPLSEGGVSQSWRANTAGVNAFAARYYLHRNDYEQAEKYATLSLNAYDVLVDYNTEMGYHTTLTIFPSTYSMVDITWKEFTSYRVASTFGLIIPSDDLMDLYDKDNDLRYTYHFVEGGPAYSGVTTADDISYSFFGTGNVPSGTTVAEVLLTKAEALARMDRVPEAMNAVNLLRSRRIKAGTAHEFTASDKAVATSKILEERRRELPFAMRWFDLRRLNHNEDPADNKTLTREFYPISITGADTGAPLMTYTLEPGSRKYAIMIPRTDVIASQDKITQNTY